MSQSLEGVDPRLVAGFMQLSQVCNISVSSGMRTDAEQVDLYRRWQAGEPGIFMPAKPASMGGNGSPHNRGQAIDVDGDLGCAHQNAARFGLSFPLGERDPVHMEWAGGGEGYESATGATFEDRDGNPVPAPKPTDPIPGIMGAVTAALKGDRTEIGGIGSVEELSQALGKKPEPPAIESGGTAAQMSGGAITGNGIYEMILNGIGAPVSDENMRLLDAWARAEGMPAESNNPLATTEGNTPGVAGTHNSIGVKLYDSPQSGAQAIVKTLLNGRYNHIVDAMRVNNLAEAAIGIENSPWGTGGLVRKILGV